METSNKKDGAKVRFPPPILPVITIVGGHYLSVFVPLVSGYDLPTPARYWIGGLIAAGALLVLGVWPVVLFDKAGQNQLPWTPTTEIIILFAIRPEEAYLEGKFGDSYRAYKQKVRRWI